MKANGCGIFGLYSKVYKFIKKKLPPFQYACDEHDIGYYYAKTYADRLKEDEGFRDKVGETGYKKTAKVFYFLVRSLGWIAIIKRELLRYAGKLS